MRRMCGFRQHSGAILRAEFHQMFLSGTFFLNLQIQRIAPRAHSVKKPSSPMSRHYCPRNNGPFAQGFCNHSSSPVAGARISGLLRRVLWFRSAALPFIAIAQENAGSQGNSLFINRGGIMTKVPSIGSTGHGRATEKRGQLV